MPSSLSAIPHHPEQFVQWFRHAAPYIHAFRDRVFVIAFGGEVVEAGKFQNLVHDFNLLHSLDVRLVLVHGARPQVEARLRERGAVIHYEQGLRVTDAQAMVAVKEAVGTVRVEIEALLSMGLADSPMAGADLRVASGNFVTAKPAGVRDGVDLLLTGEVRKVDAAGVSRRLEAGEMVLLSPLGYSPTGEIFNLSLEDVATAAAIALDADKLIFLTDAPGVHGAQGELLHTLTVGQARAALARPETLSEDASLYLPHAVRACENGVRRAHLIDRDIDGALLLELFTHQGVGTMLSEASVETLRPAAVQDVGQIVALLRPLEDDGVLVRRSRELLEVEIGRFSVMQCDGRVIGCAALYPFPDARAGELAALAVHPDYRGSGRGERLLDYMEAQARDLGLDELFVLTTRTAHWFVERGFAEAGVERLPEARQGLYNYRRRSKVFVKPLQDSPPPA